MYELLANGTSLSIIPANIQTMYETLHSKPTEEFPSVSFVHSCHVIVEVIGETITAIELANTTTWH